MIIFNYFKKITGIFFILIVSAQMLGQDNSLFAKIYAAGESLSYSGIVRIEEHQSSSLYEVSNQIDGANKNYKVKRIGSRKQNELISTELSILSRNDRLSCNAEFPQLCMNLLNLMQFNIDLVQQNYSPAKIVSRTVAGIDTNCYELTGDMYRPNFNLCIDEATGKVLYLEIKGKNNEVQRRLSYVWIEYNPKFPADTFNQNVGYKFNGTETDFHKYLGFGQFLLPQVKFNWLPKGFVQSSEAPNMTLFDDGLVKFTVYIKPAKQTTPFYVRRANGLTMAQMSIVNDNILYKAILVGEIDIDAVEQILSSITIQ